MTKQYSLFDTIEGDTYSSICASIGVQPNSPGWPDAFGTRIKQYLSQNVIPGIRTLSLFSGAGGLDIGFSDIGFNIVDSVELESKFCKTLELNSGMGKRFENSTVNCVDIRHFSGDSVGQVDFIIGGPPCQTFSAAGRRANGVLGLTDSRGVLFKEYVRLLEKLSPRGFLFENVYGIVGAQGGQAWREIRDSFASVGYQLFYRIVDAADYGAPQHRERLIIVGLKEGSFKFPRPTHGPDSIDEQPFYNAGTALSGLVQDDEELTLGLKGRYGSLLNDIPPGLNYSFYTKEMGHPSPIFAWRSKFSDFLYKADPTEPVRTIKASGGAYTGPFHWDNRAFSLKEYKRLQTFPDDYEISGNMQTAVKQIGNSVPPQLARMMAIAIRQQVFNTVFPFKLSLLEDTEVLSFRKRKHDLTKKYKAIAAQSITKTTSKQQTLPKSHSYYCSLSNVFDYVVGSSEESDYKVIVRWGKALTITVEDTQEEKSTNLVTLKLNPSNYEINLNISKIEIRVRSNRILAYTAGWRAFEHELIRNNIKADLVQLNGYYQYTPKLLGNCTFFSKYPYSSLIEKIVAGTCVGRITSSAELAETWGIPESELFSFAEFLRKIGYEIRNHNTNPQIDEGYWLLPYSFPTLTKMSVQFRKNL